MQILAKAHTLWSDLVTENGPKADMNINEPFWFMLIDILTTLPCLYETSGSWAFKDIPYFTIEICGLDYFCAQA